MPRAPILALAAALSACAATQQAPEARRPPTLRETAYAAAVMAAAERVGRMTDAELAREVAGLPPQAACPAAPTPGLPALPPPPPLNHRT